MIFVTKEWVSQKMLAIKAFRWPLSLVWGHVCRVLSPWNFLRGWTVIVICLPGGRCLRVAAGQYRDQSGD